MCTRRDLGRTKASRYLLDGVVPRDKWYCYNTGARHRFLTSFQLTITVQWDKAKVANILSLVRSSSLSNPKEDIPLIGDRLRECNKPRNRQTSAASKIINFAKPKLPVFIWDDLVSRAARTRDALLAGSKERPRSGVYLREGEHDYSGLYEACARALSEEHSRPDFQEAVLQLDKELREQGGLLAERELVPVNFVERRLLDKLMFWEGWYKRPLPP